MAAVTGSQYKSTADFNSSPRNFFPHRGIGRTANFEALSWPQFTRQLAINKFIRQIFMQGFVNKSLFTYIKTHFSTVNGQLIFPRPGKVTSRACTEQIQVDRFRTESTLGLEGRMRAARRSRGASILCILLFSSGLRRLS